MGSFRRVARPGHVLTALLVAAPASASAAGVPAAGDAASIQAAIDAAASGDTIYIASGVYPGALSVTGKRVDLVGRCSSGVACVVLSGPVSCRHGGLTLRSVVADGGDEVAVSADECTLRAFDSVLRGDVGVEASLGSRNNLMLRDTDVLGDSAGMVVSGGQTVAVVRSRVTAGSGMAVDIDGAVAVSIKESEVASETIPLWIGASDLVEVRSSRVDSPHAEGGDISAGRLEIEETEWSSYGDGPGFAVADAEGGDIVRSRFTSVEGADLRLGEGSFEVSASCFSGGSMGVAVYYGSALLANNMTSGSLGGVGAYGGGSVEVWNHLFLDHAVAMDARSGSVTASYVDLHHVDDDAWGSAAGSSWYRFDPRVVDTEGTLAEGSPAIDAGAPSTRYRDADGTRNDLGPTGGPDAG